MAFTVTTLCAERSALGKTLSDAISRVYAIRGELDDAKQGKADRDSLDALRSSLQTCRDDELKAERAYREHVQAHGCSAEARSAAAGVGAGISRHLRS